MTPIVINITVSPSREPDGRKAYSRSGQLFDGTIDGRLVVERTTTPFCDAARVLAGEGIDPATKIVMRHQGKDHDALRSTVGAAAKLTVQDSNDGRSRFTKWHPHPRALERINQTPSMREPDPAAPGAPEPVAASPGGAP